MAQMFKTTYIYELIKGQLSENGYRHFLNSISFYIRKFNWPNSIVINSEKRNSNLWTPDDINELAHQYFEWIIIKDKIKYLNKIPEGYLSYYFLQMLISFVSDRIMQEQKRQGLSFEKCKELVLSLSKSDFFNERIDELEFVYIQKINKKDFKPEYEVQQSINFLSKIPITDKTKHFKPLVKIAIEDIFKIVESPIEINMLIKFVYALFDQKSFILHEIYIETNSTESNELINQEHKKVIFDLLSDMTKGDALLFLEYLFKSDLESPLTDPAFKHNLPKSTIYHKLKKFKKKIFNIYTPENEEDGILFIQNIKKALDKLSK